MGRLVLAADDQGRLAPLRLVQAQIGGRHGAVGAVGEEDEAVLVELARAPLELFTPGRGLPLRGGQGLPAAAQLPDPAPVVVAGDHQRSLGVGDGLRLVLFRQRPDQGGELRPAAGDQQGDAAGRARMDHHLDRLRPRDLQPRRFRQGLDGDAAPGGRPVRLGLADPRPDRKPELWQVLAEHGEGAARRGLPLDGLPEGDERLVRQRETHLRVEGAEVEDVLVVGQKLLGLRRRGAEGLKLKPSAHTGSLKYFGASP